MRHMIKCYACMEHGVVILGDLFTVKRCDYCYGKGWRYIYTGDLAKEEKHFDDHLEQERLSNETRWERERVLGNFKQWEKI
jgi:hypothetical protein